MAIYCKTCTQLMRRLVFGMRKGQAGPCSAGQNAAAVRQWTKLLPPKTPLYWLHTNTMTLATLKPRIQTQGGRIPTITPGSWRTNKAGSSERGYTYKWQQAREGWLRKHPLCRYCEREGRVTIATVVDHITPHRGNMTVFWDSENWQSLCKMHHDGQKAREEQRS